MLGIGRRIKYYREQKNLTQQELADIMGYKSKSTIGKIETGVNDINQSTAVKFAKALNVPDMTYNIYRHKFAKIIEFLGSKHTMHDTRHTFTTIAKEQNMNEYILKRILGHSIRDITEQIYTHRDNNTLLDAVNKLII